MLKTTIIDEDVFPVTFVYVIPGNVVYLSVVFTLFMLFCRNNERSNRNVSKFLETSRNYSKF